MLDQHGQTLLCTRCSLGARSHSSDCGARFEAIWTEELAETEIPIDPNMRDSAAVEPAAAASGQLAAMEVSTDPAGQRFNRT